MSDRILKAMREDLDDWRARLDELRLQASLGKLELRERSEALRAAFEGARTQALARLAQVERDTKDDVRALRTSIEAGWDELRRTYRELSAKKPRSPPPSLSL